MNRSENKHSISLLCGLFGVSRQSWYFNQKRVEKQAFETEILLKLIREQRKLMPRIGAKKLLYILKDEFKSHGIKIGRDKFFTFLRENNLLVNKKRKYTKTTNSFHRYYMYPNLIKKIRFIKPNRLYVSDITYVKLTKGFAYLSLITDAYSRKIVGYKLHKDLSRDGCIYALQMAISGLGEDDKYIVHHSDRGSQYCSDEYVRILKRNKFLISMTENGDPYENALAERVNGILKDEFNLDSSFKDFISAEKHVKNAIEVYNNNRPHLSLNYNTPNAVHFREDENYNYSYKISSYNTSKGNVIISDKQSYCITIN